MFLCNVVPTWTYSCDRVGDFCAAAEVCDSAPHRERPMRVLITGAGGFVGVNAARLLVRQGALLTAAVRPNSRPERLAYLPKEVTVVPLALDSPAAVDDLVGATKPDAVLHLAAHGGYAWQTHAQEMIQT